MAEKPETRFKRKVVAALEKIPMVKVFVIQQLAKRGDPDLLICYKGKFVALELKRSDKFDGSPLQSHILGKVVLAGGYAKVCTPENLTQTLDEIGRLV